MKLYLGKQDKNIAANQASGEDRLPYFKLSVPPEQPGGEWKEVGAFWRSKSGKGYNGKLAEGVTILFEKPMPLSPSPLKKIQSVELD